MKRLLLPLLFLVGGTAFAAHPSLLVDATGLAVIKERVATDDWAKRWYDGLLRSADASLSATFTVPERGAGWEHDYACPEHAAPLMPVSPTAHRCPVDGHVFSGDPYDAAYLTRIHHANSSAVETLGLAYALTGRIEFARRTREILVAYGTKYPEWALHGRRPGPVPRDGARMFAQTLDESIAMLSFLAGYDLTCDSGAYSASDREVIEEKWIRASIRTIQRPAPGPSNWHTWHNAFFLWAGYVLGDDALVDNTLNGPWGVYDQLNRSVDGDGFWYEGAISYHFYALGALVKSAEAAYHNGENVWTNARLLSMFTAPLALAWPDGRFPALNDSHPGSLFDRTDLYRVAFHRTGVPELRFPFFDDPPGDLTAVLHHPTRMPEKVMIQWGDTLFRHAGLSILRTLTIPQHGALLKWGPHGGWHGHPDKLNLLLYCDGRERLFDPGAVSYSVPSYTTWYKRTLSHNTLVVDGQTQNPAEGRTLGFGETKVGSWTRADCSTAYPGVTLDRTVFLGPNFAVDVFRATGEAEHTFDLAYHFTGRMTCSGPLRDATLPVPPDASPAYAHLSRVRCGTVEEPWQASIEDGTAPLRLTGQAEPGTFLAAASAPGYRPAEGSAMLLVRKTGEGAVFVHVLDWSERGVRWDRRDEPGAIVLRMAPTGWPERLMIRFPESPEEPVTLSHSGE